MPPPVEVEGTLIGGAVATAADILIYYDNKEEEELSKRVIGVCRQGTLEMNYCFCLRCVVELCCALRVEFLDFGESGASLVCLPSGSPSRIYLTALANCTLCSISLLNTFLTTYIL